MRKTRFENTIPDSLAVIPIQINYLETKQPVFEWVVMVEYSGRSQFITKSDVAIRLKSLSRLAAFNLSPERN